MQEVKNEPLNFDKVWAALMENREQLKESDRLFKEQKKESDRQWKETKEELGRIGRRFGEFTESMVRPDVVKKFNSLGFHFTDMCQNFMVRDPETGRSIAEVDIILENGDFIIAVEVKFKLQTKDIDEHIERIEVLRGIADSRNDSRKYRGAIASAIVTDQTRDYAHKSGFYVIEQSGDIMKLDIPDDFIPKEW